MTGQHLSLTALTLLLTITGALVYGAIVLYGAWVDGRRQDLRNKGMHPVTNPDGTVHAREEEEQDGSNRG